MESAIGKENVRDDIDSSKININSVRSSRLAVRVHFLSFILFLLSKIISVRAVD